MKRFYQWTAGVIMAAILSLGLSVSSQAATYKIDPSHTNMGFAVKHLMVTTVSGTFQDFEGTITFEEGNTDAFTADVAIQVGSIDTNNEKRDGHLRSGDFFNAEEYPVIRFQSEKLVKTENGYDVTGDLTIKDVTKTVTIPVQILGPVTGMGGGQVIGLEGQTTIDRQEFNVTWNKTLDNGGLVVGNDVTLNISIEAHAE